MEGFSTSFLRQLPIKSLQDIKEPPWEAWHRHAETGMLGAGRKGQAESRATVRLVQTPGSPRTAPQWLGCWGRPYRGWAHGQRMAAMENGTQWKQTQYLCVGQPVFLENSTTCRILVPRSGIELMLSALGAYSLNPWSIREVLDNLLSSSSYS